MEHYVTKIQIREVRHFSDIEIELKQEKRTHLLLTGKNGSGKTSLLRVIKKHLTALQEREFINLVKLSSWKEIVQGRQENLENVEDGYKKAVLSEEIKARSQFIKKYEIYQEGCAVTFHEGGEIQKLYDEGKFLTAFYGANRKIETAGAGRAKGVSNVVLNKVYSVDSNPGGLLLQYLVHLRTQQAYARNEGDRETVEMLDKWFVRFENALKVLLDNESIRLVYDYKDYNFLIMEEGRKAYGFDQLSDGYSAAIQILTDLILRMEQNWLKEGILSAYDMEGIVLIDELETHLHIELQRKILPFLTEFFPRIQFIVSTHSPYILNSIENCVIYDLEKHIRMENMSGYSAEGIVEGYFEVDAYSELLLRKVKRYETLVNMEEPAEEERVERAKLLVELKQLSGDLAKEAKDAFEEIEQRRKEHNKIRS